MSTNNNNTTFFVIKCYLKYGIIYFEFEKGSDLKVHQYKKK